MTIRVSRDIYSKEVLLKTAYSLTDKVYLHLEKDDKDWIVSWTPKQGQTINEGEFENELISQSLRAKLLEQTSDLRKIILARALASTVLDDKEDSLHFPIQENEEESSLSNVYHVTEQEKEEILKGWFDQ